MAAGGDEERGFGEVVLCGDALHGDVVPELVAEDDYGGRVSFEQAGRERVDLVHRYVQRHAAAARRWVAARAATLA
jgi:hypothetical protein